jgi:hypothetical protein
MKTRLFRMILLLAVPVWFGGCKEEGPGPGVDLVYRHTFEIPAGIGVFDVHHFYIDDFATRYEATLAQSNKTPGDITGVITVEGAFSGAFGDADLRFVDRISIRAYTNNDPTNYIEVAYRDPAPLDPGNVIALIPSLSDSKEFFKNDRISFDIVLWLRETTQEFTPVQLDLKVRALL